MPSIDWNQSWSAVEPWIRLMLSGLIGGLVVAFVNNALQERRESSRATRDAEGRQREANERAAELLRRLNAEVDENIRRIGPRADNRIPQTEVIRSAWDQARGLSLPDAQFDAVATAYTLGERLNQALQDVRLHSLGASSRTGVDALASHWRFGAAISAAREAYDAFRVAQARLLGQPDPDPTPASQGGG